MRNRLSVAAIVALSATGLGASTAGATPFSPDGVRGPASVHNITPKVTIDQTKKKIFDRIMKRLPSNHETRIASLAKQYGVKELPQQRQARAQFKRMGEAALAGKRVSAPSAAADPCVTKLGTWFGTEINKVDPMTLYYLQKMGADQMPQFDALIFGATGDGHHSLEPTNAAELTADFGTLQNFWDVELDDVSLMGMDRNLFTKTDRLAATIQVVFEVNKTDSVAIAKDMQNLVKSDPALKGGKHPLFSFNAFASSQGDGSTIPDKVIFGDGIIAGFNAIGLGAAGPDSVLSHEMAHHVQYENNTFGTGNPTPEGTRRTELMADGFGTYAGAHKKGLNATATEITQFGQAAYEVGDCQTSSPNHHGTPAQRRAASKWGADSYSGQASRETIQPSLTLQAKFDAALPVILQAGGAAVGLKSAS